MARIGKNHFFWAGWALVVIATGVVYYVVVYPKAVEFGEIRTKQAKLYARLTDRGDDTKNVIAEAGRKQPKKRPKADDGDQAILDWVDPLIRQYYPLSRNLKELPGNAGKGAPANEVSKAKAREIERSLLVAEREGFVRELFARQNFSVDPMKEFVPPPPGDPELFKQWLMGRDGQDVKIDREFESMMDGRKCQAVEEARPQGSGGPQWLIDGRCSGHVNEGDRQLVFQRLVLRRLVLRAVARAKASALAPQDKTYANPKEALRGVERVLEVKWLGHDEYVTARDYRFHSAGLTPPARDVAPYRCVGIELKVLCHLAVVPSLLGELENIGSAENRPFAFWAEGISIERARGKPDWRPGTILGGRPEVPPAGFGDRYHEWPVEVSIRGVVPQFDLGALSKGDLAGV